MAFGGPTTAGRVTGVSSLTQGVDDRLRRIETTVDRINTSHRPGLAVESLVFIRTAATVGASEPTAPNEAAPEAWVTYEPSDAQLDYDSYHSLRLPPNLVGGLTIFALWRGETETYAGAIKSHVFRLSWTFGQLNGGVARATRTQDLVQVVPNGPAGSGSIRTWRMKFPIDQPTADSLFQCSLRRLTTDARDDYANDVRVLPALWAEFSLRAIPTG